MLWLVVIVLIVIVGLKLLTLFSRASVGVNYTRRCTLDYQRYVREGLSSEEALNKISREAYPTLSDEVHERIVYRYPDASRLGNFIFNALDMSQKHFLKHGRELRDREALAVLRHTKMDLAGRVSTDFRNVWSELD